MVSIIISNPHEYPISESVIADKLTIFLEKKGKTDCEVSIKIVDTEEMLNLAKKYLKEENTLHNVLSFTYSEATDFIDDLDGVTRLGDIAVCFEKAEEEAIEQKIDTDVWVYELVEHGATHLLGIHHK
jgi:rRNA maturation RNase YbeY